MKNRAKELKYNNRYLILFYASLAVFSASPDGDQSGQEYTVVWDDARTPEELESMKYLDDDSVLQANISQYGYRFGFVPTEAAMTSENYTRISIRFEFEVTSGRSMNRVFVQIMEMNKSNAGFPYSGFHYKNLSPFRAMHKSMEIPIPPAMMERWLSKEDAEIGFILKFDFGFLSNVKIVTAKVPVLIFSYSERPKCSEHACCLTAKRTVEFTRRPVYKNLVQPLAVDHRRCIECIRASEDYEPDLGTFGMFLHGKYKPEEVPRPTQLGRCRATDWSSLQTIFMAKDDKVYQMDFPYFNANKCECVEDEDVSPDYITEQQDKDHYARIHRLRPNKTTKNPPTNP